jgi:GNAT superfamily N-acetyltransferase
MRIETFSPSHRQGVIDALTAVRACGGNYPPPHVGADAVSVGSWLEQHPCVIRLVALYGENVAGHVQLVDPAAAHPALSRFLIRHTDISPVATLELSRLFVAPGYAGLGLGRRLLEAATEACDRMELRAVLRVRAEQSAAVALYRRVGWVELGGYRSDTGAVMLGFAAPRSGRAW